jgi:hypothetical protein
MVRKVAQAQASNKIPEKQKCARMARSIRGSQSNQLTQGTDLMNAAVKTALLIAFTLVVVLILMFGGGTMTGATLSGGMMGNGTMGGISWMWIPTLLMLSLGVLLVWVIFGQKK